jgi:hypothetical protein
MPFHRYALTSPVACFASQSFSEGWSPVTLRLTPLSYQLSAFNPEPLTASSSVSAFGLCP